MTTTVLSEQDRGARTDESVALQTIGLRKWFPVERGVFGARKRGGMLHAVDDVDLRIGCGELVGLVGESGCGKTTLARTLLRLYEPDDGQITILGMDFTTLKGASLRRARRHVQMVFQDPFSSLNPRQSVRQILTEAIRYHHVCSRSAEEAHIAALLDRVGLMSGHADKHASEFSGGQRQRIGIARALSVEPRILIADEPISSLDVSIQARILELLSNLQREMELALLLVTHDLAVVYQVADRVAVMYLGQIVEEAPTDDLFVRPHHPYTKVLLASAPRLGRRIAETQSAVEGDPPNPVDPPELCRFLGRCVEALPVCRVESPPMATVAYGRGHYSRCHLPIDGV